MSAGRERSTTGLWAAHEFHIGNHCIKQTAKPGIISETHNSLTPHCYGRSAGQGEQEHMSTCVCTHACLWLATSMLLTQWLIPHHLQSKFVDKNRLRAAWLNQALRSREHPFLGSKLAPLVSDFTSIKKGKGPHSLFPNHLSPKTHSRKEELLQLHCSQTSQRSSESPALSRTRNVSRSC